MGADTSRSDDEHAVPPELLHHAWADDLHTRLTVGGARAIGDAVRERTALLLGDHAAGLCGGRDYRVFNTKDGDVLPG